MRLFVTIGTTEFRELIVPLCTNPNLHDLLETLGYRQLIVQAGKQGLEYARSCFTNYENEESPHTLSIPLSNQLHLTVFAYRSNLVMEIEHAHCVIAHAGAGSILEALRTHLASGIQDRKVLVVINNHLMDNHQQELAIALHLQNYLVSCTTGDLLQGIQAVHNAHLTPFPPQDPIRFQQLFSEIILN